MKKPPVIIIDGPDNVGKGTQIKLLRSWLHKIPFCISNLDKPVGENLDEKKVYGIKAIDNQLASLHAGWKSGIPSIADRAWPSEYAYSILRNTHSLEAILDIEEKYLDMSSDVLGIIFIDEAQQISERDDGHSNYDSENLEEINRIIHRFCKLAEQSHFTLEVININKKAIEDVHLEVQQTILKAFPHIIDDKNV